MTEDAHKKAERLVLQSRVEGIAGPHGPHGPHGPDQRWLDEHLAQCERCAGYAQSVSQAVRSLRSVSVVVDPELVSSTRLRVYLRARELSRKRERMGIMWGCCALSWVAGAVTAPLVWRAFEWLGAETGLPRIIWESGFVTWWFAPAAAALAVIAWRRSRDVKEEPQLPTG
ncbi:MAG: hypothetical protein ACRD1I_03775 [Terriglobia bacterium]